MNMNQPNPKTSVRPFKGERGQSLMEFAFSLVVLLLLVSGIVDGSRALFTYLSMRDAAQEGALYASFNPSDVSGINQRTRSSSGIMSGLGSNITVVVSPTVNGLYCAGTTGGKDHGIKVGIYYAKFPLTMPFIGMFVGSQTVPMSAEVTDSIITPACK